jgi:hypothetical protein
VRINTAPHAVVWPSSKHGEEHKQDVYAGIFTSSGKDQVHSTLKGIKQADEMGRIKVNPDSIYNNDASFFLHLHPTEDGSSKIFIFYLF